MGKWTFLPLFVTLIHGCAREERAIVRERFDLAQLSVEGTSVVEFPLITVGSRLTHFFKVKNIGASTAFELSGHFTVSAFGYEGGFPGPAGTCTDTLQHGESCLLEVEFAPGYAGMFEETLRIEYFNGITKTTTTLPLLRGRGRVIS